MCTSSSFPYTTLINLAPNYANARSTKLENGLNFDPWGLLTTLIVASLALIKDPNSLDHVVLGNKPIASMAQALL